MIKLWVLTITLLATSNAWASNPPNFGTTVKTQVKMNSSFCKCDESKDLYSLVRVDISQGKKFETQIRTFKKESFTLPQCEGFIKDHPSCK